MARVMRYANPDELADAAAQQLLSRLGATIEDRGEADLCLTGGRIANRMYERLAAMAAEQDFDASTLNLWWGDERFVGLTDPERNAGQSFALLAGSMSLSPARIHPMPPRDGHADPSAAAFDYARELGSTIFDVCLLGIGEDGHVASLFPNHPSSAPTSATVIGVTDSPKPPSERVSLTLNAINRSRSVWLMASGEGKAEAVAAALNGDLDLPAANVHGTEETLWFLDAEAAGQLPTYNCML